MDGCACLGALTFKLIRLNCSVRKLCVFRFKWIERNAHDDLVLLIALLLIILVEWCYPYTKKRAIKQKINETKLQIPHRH